MRSMCQTLFFFFFSVEGSFAWFSRWKFWPGVQLPVEGNDHLLCAGQTCGKITWYSCAEKNKISGMSLIRTEACGVLAGGNHLSSRSRFLAGALTLNIIKHSPRNSFATAQNSFSWTSFATLFEIAVPSHFNHLWSTCCVHITCPCCRQSFISVS